VNDLDSGNDTSQAELDRLAEVCAEVIRHSSAQGASAAEVAASIEIGLGVTARLGDVETIEHTRDRGISLTVYFGQRKGSASTADIDPRSIAQTVEHACAIARYTEEDPANGLPDAALLAREFPDLDLWHPWNLAPDAAIRLALEIEDAGRAEDPRIVNSEGAVVQVGASLAAYANSLGFAGRERGTHHTLSCVLLAEDAAGMQRDYAYDVARAPGDLAPAAGIGRRAAERTVARLGARRVPTGQYPVLFVPETARSLVGHFLSAISGGALYRRASFLLDRVGQPVFPAFMRMSERPFLRRGHGSAVFDAEGVATRESDIVAGGVLQHYLLGSYSARKLGLATTGNAGGVHNLLVEPGTDDFPALLRRMGRGLVVTELMGQGVSLVTGDYSRGASGFWVEDGVIAHPVEEITIAANLGDMFRGIIAVGNDIDRRSHLLTGSILLERMTLAGA
jgi:PmbA protein